MFYKIFASIERNVIREYGYDSYKDFINALKWMYDESGWYSIAKVKIGEIEFEGLCKILIKDESFVYFQKPVLKEDREYVYNSVISGSGDSWLRNSAHSGLIYAPYYSIIDQQVKCVAVDIKSFRDKVGLCFEMSLGSSDGVDNNYLHSLYKQTEIIKKNVYLYEKLEDVMEDILFDLIDSIYKNQTFYHELIEGKHEDFVFDGIEKYCQSEEWN